MLPRLRAAGLGLLLICAVGLAADDPPQPKPRVPIRLRDKDAPTVVEKAPPPAAQPESPKDPALEAARVLEKAGLKTDPEALLSFFRTRTLTDDDRARLLDTIRRLGDDDFDVREAASQELTRAGLAALPLLRAAGRDKDEEVARRIERCLSAINQDSETNRIVAAAHLLGHQKVDGAAAVLLAYLPSVPDDEAVAEGIRSALTLLARNTGKADPLIVAALSDKDPARRAMAAQVLGEALAEQRPAVKKLLADPEPKVRFIAATTLLKTGDKGVMPDLLNMLGEGPLEYAYQVEDVLCQLVGDGKVPGTLSGGDAKAREKVRAAWEAWWKEAGPKVDLARLLDGEPLKGLTIVLEVDGVGGGAGNNGRVWECGPDGKQRWEWLNVSGPVDVQVLPGGRYLLAEYYASRVTERDREGKILWESPRLNGNTVAAQRLPNGNTLIATMSDVTEIGRDKKTVATYQRPAGTVFHTRRAKNGHTFILAGSELAEMDTDRKLLRKVSVGSLSGWGGFDFLPNGNFLVCYYTASRKYAEVGGDGKPVWEHTVNFEPTRVQRLRNGNTLLAGGNSHFVAEYDRDKKEVWKVATKGRPFGALRY